MEKNERRNLCVSVFRTGETTSKEAVTAAWIGLIRIMDQHRTALPPDYEKDEKIQPNTDHP